MFTFSSTVEIGMKPPNKPIIDVPIKLNIKEPK